MVLHYPGVFARLDSVGNLIQLTFAPIPSVRASFARPDAATILTEANYQLEAVTFGPAPEVQLTCAASAASMLPAPLTPVEIVSLYGSNLGPTQPTSGQPGPDGRYPTLLAGTQVTFDGIPAPLLYVSASQINTVTPSALGRNDDDPYLRDGERSRRELHGCTGAVGQSGYLSG
jgi:hypothetical protein